MSVCASPLGLGLLKPCRVSQEQHLGDGRQHQISVSQLDAGGCLCCPDRRRSSAPAAAAPTPKPPQPEAPLSLSGTSESLATLVWQVAAKEGQLEKVQDELQQVRPFPARQGLCLCGPGWLQQQQQQLDLGCVGQRNLVATCSGNCSFQDGWFIPQ